MPTKPEAKKYVTAEEFDKVTKTLDVLTGLVTELTNRPAPTVAETK